MFTFGKDKKKKKPEKAPVWFMWLMGVFIVYALITNIFTDKVAEVQEREAAEGRSEGESINFAVVKGVGTGGPALPLYSQDKNKGQGAMATCWHTVGVRYRLYNGEGEKIEEITEDQPPLRFTIGKREVIPGLERGVLGMRTGGERIITARPELAFSSHKFSHPKLERHDFVGYVLTLENSERPENLPRSDLGLRIYDDKEGSGLAVQCTDRARIRLHGYGLDGKELFGREEFPSLLFYIGEGQAPYAVERAVMGMKLGGRRTVIVPPGYMTPLFATAPEIAQPAEEENTPPEPEVTDAAEPAEIQQTEEVSPKAGAEEKNAEDHAEKTAWKRLPVPQDQAIVLEIELLPPYVAAPTKP